MTVDGTPHVDDGVFVSTGQLPRPEAVRHHLEAAYERHRSVDDGKVADYIPALAQASPLAFGACIAGVAGQTISVGDATTPFSIQSVSKPFVFALVCEAIGPRRAGELLGTNATGLPFDSVMAVELNRSRTMNPLVNAGAIATTSLLPGSTVEEKWAHVVEGLSAFAGRPLRLDQDVYRSEAATNLRNRGIAHLLESYGSITFDPDDATEVYTRQCSLSVTAEDLAVMGATLADGGVNPRTGKRVIAMANCRRVLAVMATAGLYEESGEWLYEVGLPGKSGVSGGIVTVSPGKGGLGTYSPPLDEQGNSVRGRLLTTQIAEVLGLHIFASAVHPDVGSSSA